MWKYERRPHIKNTTKGPAHRGRARHNSTRLHRSFYLRRWSERRQSRAERADDPSSRKRRVNGDGEAACGRKNGVGFAVGRDVGGTGHRGRGGAGEGARHREANLTKNGISRGKSHGQAHPGKTARTGQLQIPSPKVSGKRGERACGWLHHAMVAWRDLPTGNWPAQQGRLEMERA